MEMIVFGTGMFVLAAGICLYGRQKQRRLLERLESMLEKARSGNFRQEEIDETMVSSVENSMARFLEDSRLAEENLNQSKERIQTMISDISHQTAIPISNILVYSQLLEEDCTDPQMREYGTVIRQQGEKLQFLLDSLVKISRLENGIIQTVPQKGELGELACQVKSLMEQKAGKRSAGRIRRGRRGYPFSGYQNERFKRHRYGHPASEDFSPYCNYLHHRLSAGENSFCK